MNNIRVSYTSLNLEYYGIAGKFTVESKNLTRFSYEDKSSGESDSVSIDIYDREQVWLNDHFPRKKDIIKASITHFNGMSEKTLNCGQFTLDDINISGEPLIVNLNAVSSPVTTGFSVTKHSKVWKNITMKNIALDIASRAGISFYYDADEIYISAVEQSDQTDSSFLSQLCKDFGLCMKVYSNKLVLYGLEKTLNQEPVKTIKRTEVEPSWYFETSLDGKYTGGQLTYSNIEGTDIKYSTGDGDRILKITDKKPQNLYEAELMTKAALLFANLETTKLSFQTSGRLDIVASQNIKIIGFGGEIDGIYHITNIKHSISNGFKTSFEGAKVS